MLSSPLNLTTHIFFSYCDREMYSALFVVNCIIKKYFYIYGSAEQHNRSNGIFSSVLLRQLSCHTKNSPAPIMAVPAMNYLLLIRMVVAPR